MTEIFRKGLLGPISMPKKEAVKTPHRIQADETMMMSLKKRLSWEEAFLELPFEEKADGEVDQAVACVGYNHGEEEGEKDQNPKRGVFVGSSRGIVDMDGILATFLAPLFSIQVGILSWGSIEISSAKTSKPLRRPWSAFTLVSGIQASMAKSDWPSGEATSCLASWR